MKALAAGYWLLGITYEAKSLALVLEYWTPRLARLCTASSVKAGGSYPEAESLSNPNQNRHESKGILRPLALATPPVVSCVEQLREEEDIVKVNSALGLEIGLAFRGISGVNYLYVGLVLRVQNLGR